MILYLYAMVDGVEDVATLTGVAGEPLALLSLHDTVVAAGWIDAAPPVDRNHLAAQDALVRTLHDRAAALLPMRFGASFASAADAERAIKTMSAGLAERLDRARGREQMTIRVLGGLGTDGITGGTDGITGGTSGTQGSGVGARYLAERAAKATPPEIAPLLQALKPIQRATRVEPGRRAGIVATIYQLIDRGTADDYRAALELAAADMPALTVRVTGPSPCYAFA